MFHDGLKFYRNSKLGFRNAEDGDTLISGDVIDRSCVVFVSISKCRLYTSEDGRRHYYDAKGVAHLPVSGHGSTNKAYGKQRKYNRPDRFRYRDHDGEWRNGLFDFYYATPVYLAHDGSVYRATAYNVLVDGELRYALKV